MIKNTFACVATACLLLTGCGGPDAPSSAEKSTYRIVSTVGMVADVVQKIAGDEAGIEAQGLIGQGVDPHLYAPTRTDVVALQSADLIFYNGLMLEGKMADTLVKVGRGKPVVAVTEALLERPDYVAVDEAEHYDPHVWMDPSAWALAAETIRDTLINELPEHQDAFAQNADALIAEIHALDTYAKQVLSTIPKERRVLVTAHDAFGYLGRAYGIDVRGVQGISTESEAALKQINDLVNFIVTRKIPAIFVESSVPTKAIEAVIDGCKSQGHTVTIGGELFSDAMGPAGTYEGTYIGMIDHNVTTITRALGGQAPVKGMNEKLSDH